MDIYCPKCGEPWDIDSLHGEVEVRLADIPNRSSYEKTFETVRQDFYRRGCVALRATCGCVLPETDSTFGLTRAEASASLMEMLGDDIDGVASMLDDMRF